MFLTPSIAGAFVIGGRWTNTATGAASASGKPVTLTWSLAPDSTTIEQAGASDLIAYLDNQFGGGLNTDPLASRPWFPLLEQSFARWSALGGLTLVYEPVDDGAPLRTASGELDLRGDIRLGGSFIDGPGGTLLQTSLPDSGDIIFDTSEVGALANPTDTYRVFRNALMHELGHAFGLLHLLSSTDAFLLEPQLNTSFDGPQLDDIRGLQSLYGDALERSNSGVGNGTPPLATALGDLTANGSLAIGTAAAGSQRVEPLETDFVSIANRNDADVFAFSVSGPSLLDVLLTPQGGQFMQAAENGAQSWFNANARSDLALAIIAADGTSLLGLTNHDGAGATESFTDLLLPTAGTYYVRVTGASDNVQFYSLQLAATSALTMPEPASLALLGTPLLALGMIRRKSG